MKNIVFYTRPLDFFSTKTIKYFHDNLTIGEDSMFKKIFIKTIIHKENKWEVDKYIVITAKKNNKYIGISLVKIEYCDKPQVMFYVKPEHRRKGVASALYVKALKLLKKKGCNEIRSSPWDSVSESFFSSLNFTLNFALQDYYVDFDWTKSI